MSAQEELDAATVQKTLASPPFVPVEGVINFRDIGLSSGSGSQTAIRPGLLFRSGELARLTPHGADTLKQLGVRTVFDLRSDSEVAKYSSATPSVEGVEDVRVPVSDKDEYDPGILAAR